MALFARGGGVRSQWYDSLQVTFGLIALNFIAYLVFAILPDRTYNSLVLTTELFSDRSFFTLLSSMFMHGDLSHIFNNMISLFFLGVSLEPKVGHGRFLAIYLVSGLVGGIAFVVTHLLMGDPAAAVGASGAIFGLFGAYGFIIWRTHMLYGRHDGSPATEINLGWFAFMLVENIGYGIVTPGVANSAHVGGLICGFIIARALFGQNLDGVAIRRSYAGKTPVPPNTSQ